MQITTKRALVIFLGFQIIFIAILKQFPEAVEQYYSNGIYIYLSKLLRYIFGWLPFSFGDIAYTIGGILIIRWLVKSRRRIYKNTLSWCGDALATISLIYFAFNLLWGYNYYRQPLNKSLNLEADYTTGELISVTEQLIIKSNNIHKVLVKHDTLKVNFSYSKAKIFNIVSKGYDSLSKTNPELKYYQKSIKESIYSLPLTYMGFSGYLNPFTNEAQVDGLIPTYNMPVTASHEVAHQLGYAAENEANFIGALVTTHHPDIYFQYSGYTFALRYCLSELYKRDKSIYTNLLPTINKGILKNYKESQEFWMAYNNPLEPLFKKTFDTFLKANSQSKGINSYNYMVALLVNYYQKYPF